MVPLQHGEPVWTPWARINLRAQNYVNSIPVKLSFGEAFVLDFSVFFSFITLMSSCRAHLFTHCKSRYLCPVRLRMDFHLVNGFRLKLKPKWISSNQTATQNEIKGRKPSIYCERVKSDLFICMYIYFWFALYHLRPFLVQIKQIVVLFLLTSGGFSDYVICKPLTFECLIFHLA